MPDTTDVRPDDMLPDVAASSDPDATRIVIILDRSGSMGSARESTVAAFNEFVRDQKKLPGTATLKLVQFDDVYDVVFDKPLQDVPELTQDTFVPRGSTALYDAQGRTIADLQVEMNKMPASKRPAKVVVLTLTDGLNNASKEHTQASVAELVKTMTDKFKWQFIYLGANQDAISVGASLNYAATNTMSFGMGNVGSTLRSASASVSRMRSMTNYKTASNEEVEKVMAFSQEDREAAMGGNFAPNANDISFSSTITSTTPTSGLTGTATLDPEKDNE